MLTYSSRLEDTGDPVVFHVALLVCNTTGAAGMNIFLVPCLQLASSLNHGSGVLCEILSQGPSFHASNDDQLRMQGTSVISLPGFDRALRNSRAGPCQVTHAEEICSLPWCSGISYEMVNSWMAEVECFAPAGI